ncbi:Serum albumin [Echinococcus multilocularis]|uniref:Serum albumin n=1 Tax=Echinococcus multilocularis TaxID=6211 RepID=A0A068XVX1_ECHMU|nr:Serum albumin [Echinococcus multilocularis]
MPSNHLRHYRSLNISALLASGKYYIDENGYLVAVGNGMRYRLPSGPPEGRASGPFELQPILPGKNQQLADSAVEWLDSTTATTTTASSTTLARMNTPSRLNFTSTGVQAMPSALNLSLALIACSAALIANLGLVSISCWYLFRGKRKMQSRTMAVEPRNSIPLRTIPARREEGIGLATEVKSEVQQMGITSVSSGDSQSSSVSLSSDDYHQPRLRTRKSTAKDLPSVNPFLSNSHSCLGVGIHISLLGFLLAFLHLLITCFHITRTPLSSILCLFITSISTDTIFCVYFHLVTCLLCLILIGYLSRPSTTRSSQQRFACLALSHSLPWALAAGSALFITLKPSPSAQVNLFFTGFHASCYMEHLQELYLLTVVLLIVIPLVGEFIFLLLLFCCCRRLPRRICFLATLFPIINAVSFIPVLVVGLSNLILLPLTLDPIIIALFYRFSILIDHGEIHDLPTNHLNQDRSPLHQTVMEISPSLSSEIYFPQTILAIAPHRCIHGNELPSVSPKLCPHYQHILTHPQNCTNERSLCNEILQPAEMLSSLSAASSSNTSPATAAVMAAAAAAAAVSTKHTWSPIATTTHLTAVSSSPSTVTPSLLLRTPAGVVEAASLDRRLPLPIFLTANGKAALQGGEA